MTLFVQSDSPSISEHHRKEAASFAVALIALERNLARKGKENELRGLQLRADSTNWEGKAERDLHAYAHALIDRFVAAETSCAPLIAHLRRVEAAIPDTVRSLATEEPDACFALAALDYGLVETYTPQPQIMEAAAKLAEDLARPVIAGAAFQREEGGGLLKLFLAVKLAVSVLHEKLAKRAQIGSYAGQIAQFAAAPLQTFCDAVLCGFAYRLYEAANAKGRPELMADLLNGYSQFRQHRIQLYKFPPQSELSGVRDALNSFQTKLPDSQPLQAAIFQRARLSNLLDAVRQYPWLTQEPLAASLPERLFPFGVSALVLHDPAGGAILQYVADGFRQHSIIASPCAENTGSGLLECRAALPFGSPSFQLEDPAFCILDDARNPRHEYNADRLVSGVGGTEFWAAREVLARADCRLSAGLEDLWARYPALFGELREFGPYIVISEPQRTVLAAPKHPNGVTLPLDPSDAAALAGDELASLLRAVHVRTDGEWQAWVFAQHFDWAQRRQRSTPGRAELRAMIKARLGSLSYERLLEVLAPFDVKPTDQGRGSARWALDRANHLSPKDLARELSLAIWAIALGCERQDTYSAGSLRRQHAGRDLYVPTWQALRAGRADSGFSFLWRCLEGLEIGYEEFLDSLSTAPK